MDIRGDSRECSSYAEPCTNRHGARGASFSQLAQKGARKGLVSSSFCLPASLELHLCENSFPHQQKSFPLLFSSSYGHWRGSLESVSLWIQINFLLFLNFYYSFLQPVFPPYNPLLFGIKGSYSCSARSLIQKSFQFRRKEASRHATEEETQVHTAYCSALSPLAAGAQSVLVMGWVSGSQQQTVLVTSASPP